MDTRYLVSWDQGVVGGANGLSGRLSVHVSRPEAELIALLITECELIMNHEFFIDPIEEHKDGGKGRASLKKLNDEHKRDQERRRVPHENDTKADDTSACG